MIRPFDTVSMGSPGRLQPADGDKPSASLSGDQITELQWNNISLEPPKLPLSGDSRYLTRLWVSVNKDPREEVDKSDSSQPITTGFELRAKKFFSYHQEITYKIRAALKLLTFREQHVLVQFWSPCMVGNKQLLKSLDQPYGLGVASEELCFYRRESENNTFLVNKGHEEYNVSPPARVFSRGLPEWTFDLTNYNPKDFPLQECALRCNLHGYLALPVFDSTTELCVGVIELLTSFKYVGYAFEVQQVHRALKTENLTSPQVFDSPASKVSIERRQNELDKISGILKIVCDTHSLPLAQTWAVSPSSTFVSHNKVIEKSCSSFDTRCIGKVCMSTTALPYLVRDLDMWHFREACRQHHLDKFRGFVGRALVSHGSYYCQDVTELSEEEYPLVHNARMSRLSSSFTIFLHSVEGDYDDYVLEFFLQLDNKDSRHVLELVETLKHEVEVASTFELCEISPMDFLGPPSDLSYLSLSIKPHTIQISSTTRADTLTYEMYSSDSESSFENFATTISANVPSQCSSKQVHLNKQCDVINTTEKLANDVISDNISVVGSRKGHNATSDPNVSMLKMNVTTTDAGKSVRRNHPLKQDKGKVDSLTSKSFCLEGGFSSWPMPKQSNKRAYVTDPKLSQHIWSEKHLQQSSSSWLALHVAAFVVRVKRWGCSSKKHDFLGRWWDCGKQRYLISKLDNIYRVVRQIVGLTHWKCKSSRHAMPHRSYRGLYRTEKPEHNTNIVNTYLDVDQKLSCSGFVNANPKPSVDNVLDMVLIVKATFKDDMIKFRFPMSSGLLELENQVAQRLNVKGRRLCLKYKGEGNELVPITCDAELRTLPEILSGHTTIKLLVQLAQN